MLLLLLSLLLSRLVHTVVDTMHCSSWEKTHVEHDASTTVIVSRTFSSSSSLSTTPPPPSFFPSLPPCWQRFSSFFSSSVDTLAPPSFLFRFLLGVEEISPDLRLSRLPSAVGDFCPATSLSWFCSLSVSWLPW